MVADRYRCFVKATDRESGTPRRSGNWAAARRAWLKVYDHGIVCGDWDIPATSVREAVLYEARMLLVVPVYVLEVSTDEKTYQFGLNPWVRIVRHLPFEVRRERARLRHSPYALALRLVIFGYLVYVLLR